MSGDARFWKKVDASGICWLWNAGVGSNGYGQYWHDGGMRLAHRWAYERLVAAIPSGLQLDHLCRERLCVNPDHLEVVTQKTNIRRAQSFQIGAALQRQKSDCPAGHPYSEENTYRDPSGRRHCRTCRTAWSAERRMVKTMPEIRYEPTATPHIELWIEAVEPDIPGFEGTRAALDALGVNTGSGKR